MECEYSKCRKSFEPKRHWQKYCNPEHKKAAEAEKHEARKAASGQYTGKNPAAVALGKLGAAARNRNLSPERRSELAKRASIASAAKRKEKRLAHNEG